MQKQPDSCNGKERFKNISILSAQAFTWLHVNIISIICFESDADASIRANSFYTSPLTSHQ